MDALDHGKTVLAAILRGAANGGGRELLDAALRRLTTSHFPDPQQRVLFQLAERYQADYGDVLPRAALEFMLRGQPPGTALQYGEYYDALLAWPLDGLSFAASVDALRELAAARLTGEALAQGMEVLQRGATYGRDHLQGHADARNWVLSQFAALDSVLHIQDAPEGDMRQEAQDLMAAYSRQAEAVRSRQGVVSTGFTAIDHALGGGLWPGELDLVAAYTNDGKTSVMVHLAWHACVLQGKNVVVFTSETLRTQIRFKVVARHSVHLVNAAIAAGGDIGRWPWAHRAFAKGLNTRDIKEGKLKGTDAALLHDTIQHFATKAEHGRCYIAQVPRGATMKTIESRLARISRMFHADLVIIDYLALMRSDVKRQSRREELVEIVIGAKELARTYLDGRGVPIVSPWQINRAGYEAATGRGFYYTTADLAETAEASSTADDIVTLIGDGQDPSNGRARPLKAQLIKVRDGEKLNEPLLLTADFGTCTFTERAGISEADSQSAFGGDEFGEAPV